MTLSPKPAYAQLPNRAVGFGPYTQTTGWLHTFCVDGDKAKINTFLDAMFDKPSGGAVAYEAITSKVFVSFARFASVRADGPPDDKRGVIPENDVAVWALARRKGGSLLEMIWIPLFVFVDNSSAMASGREVYGFPKQYSRIGLPDTEPPSTGPFTAEAVVLDPFAPDTVGRWAQLFRFEEKAGKSGGGGLLSGIESIAEGIAGRLAKALGDDAEGLVEALGGRSPLFDLPVRMAFLKQFPDTADPTRACFQSIVEAEARTTHVRGGGWTSTHFEGQIDSYDSHPFAEALGIATGTHDVGPALWVNFDFIMELGTDIWTAGG
jgi:hypothetical protein